MKRVLIIAYYYPPMNNGGIQRIINFGKYLPRFGYDVHILTTNSYGTIGGEKGVFRFPDVGHDISHKSFILKAIPYKFWREAIVRLGLVGDWFYLWKKAVLDEAGHEIDFSIYDYIIASYPPISCLEIGEVISEKYNIPLVIDYRDGLMFEPFDYIMHRPIWYRNRMKKTESRLSEKAVLQITTNVNMQEYYMSKYNTNTVMIPNGVDDEEKEEQSDIELPEGFNIIYTGALGLSRKIYSINVIQKIIASNKDVNFIFIGNYDRHEYTVLKKLTNVCIFNKISHGQVLHVQKKADMLLLISGEKYSGASGKLYEYLFSKKPILNLGGKRVSERIIRESDSGKTFLPEDLDGIKEYIDSVKRGEVSFSHKGLEIYIRKNQCQKLAEILDSIKES